MAIEELMDFIESLPPISPAGLLHLLSITRISVCTSIQHEFDNNDGSRLNSLHSRIGRILNLGLSNPQCLSRVGGTIGQAQYHGPCV